jgi:hypothetical protein
MIDRLVPRDAGGRFELRLPETGTGMVQVNHFAGGVVSTGHGGVVMTGTGDVWVNGQHVVTRGGRTWVNGVEVTPGSGGAPMGDPPMPAHVRAVVPPGSTVNAESYNGDLTTSGVAEVWLRTYDGAVTATGLARASTVTSYNGDVTVGAADGVRPVVRAETYNGDIVVLDDDVRVRPKTYNGDVRYR